MKPLISKDIIRGHTATIVLNILSQGDSYGANSIINPNRN